jgi:hypothetical protein
MLERDEISDKYRSSISVVESHKLTTSRKTSLFSLRALHICEQYLDIPPVDLKIDVERNSILKFISSDISTSYQFLAEKLGTNLN